MSRYRHDAPFASAEVPPMPRQARGDGEIRPALSPRKKGKPWPARFRPGLTLLYEMPRCGVGPRRTVFFKGRMVNKRLLDDNSFSFVAAPRAGRELIG